MASVRRGTTKQTIIETPTGYKRKSGWLSDDAVKSLADKHGWQVVSVKRTA